MENQWGMLSYISLLFIYFWLMRLLLLFIDRKWEPVSMFRVAIYRFLRSLSHGFMFVYNEEMIVFVRSNK